MECRFEKPSGNSQPKLSKFSSQNSRKTGKNVSRKKYLFFSKRSSGHLKCRSDKSSGNFTKKTRVFLAQNPKKKKLSNSNQLFSQNFSSGRFESIVDRFPWNVFC